MYDFSSKRKRNYSLPLLISNLIKMYLKIRNSFRVNLPLSLNEISSGSFPGTA